MLQRTKGFGPEIESVMKRVLEAINVLRKDGYVYTGRVPWMNLLEVFKVLAV